MNHRNLFQYSLRAGLGILAVFVPLIWPLFLPLAVVVMCSLLAYDGVGRGVLAWGTALLVALELVAGMELGMFSLPFLVTALVLAVCNRIFSLTPWAGTDGWHPGDLLRTAALATVLVVVMTAGSVFVGTLVYHFGMTFMRLKIVLSPQVLIAAAIAATATIIILRRIDVPFRRRIRFGM